MEMNSSNGHCQTGSCPYEKNQKILKSSVTKIEFSGTVLKYIEVVVKFNWILDN